MCRFIKDKEVIHNFQTKIDRIQGADIQALEAKIQQHIGSAGGEEAGEDYGQGMVSYYFK